MEIPYFSFPNKNKEVNSSAIDFTDNMTGIVHTEE
jgi:hypothetical protein